VVDATYPPKLPFDPAESPNVNSAVSFQLYEFTVMRKCRKRAGDGAHWHKRRTADEQNSSSSVNSTDRLEIQATTSLVVWAGVPM
jgi:hypothetical protein